MSQIKFGFIGAGGITPYAADAIKGHPSASVVAVQDLNPERLRKLCSERGIPKAYATAGELLADPGIDAVYVAVPNKFHVPLAIQALEAGKHVILEKPFAMNHAEALRAAEAARSAGRVLTLGMNQRFLPMPQKIRSLVQGGKLGEIYHAKAWWFRRSGIPKLGTWFGSKELAGGGCLYDIGVHLLDLCLYLVGDFSPVSVTGATYSKFGNRGLGEGGWGQSERSDIKFDVEDFASGFLRFASGLTISLDVSWACHTGENDGWDVQLYGTEAGALAVSGKVFRPGDGGDGYAVIQDPAASVAFPHGDRFHNFINHLLGTEPLCVTLDQALAVQRILDALAESAVTGREVRLAP